MSANTAPNAPVDAAAALLALVRAGWRRGGAVAAPDLVAALDAGAAFAARACRFDGAFGHGARFVPDGVP